MTTPGFITAGLAAIHDALVGAADKAGLILRHYAITRTAARRFRSSVRALETVLRRLVCLMAVEVELATAKPGPDKDAEPARPELRRARQRLPGFVLVPLATYDAARFETLRARPRTTSAAPPKIAPLLYRYKTLLTHLKHPGVLARRMARHLAALKSAGEPRPICPPQDRLHRFDATLGLVAAGLPDAINAALEGWYEDGWSETG